MVGGRGGNTDERGGGCDFGCGGGGSDVGGVSGGGGGSTDDNDGVGGGRGYSPHVSNWRYFCHRLPLEERNHKRVKTNNISQLYRHPCTPYQRRPIIVDCRRTPQDNTPTLRKLFAEF